MQNKYSIFSNLSQEQYNDIGENAPLKTLRKVSILKGYNVPIIKTLLDLGESRKAAAIEQCGTFLEIYNDADGIERVKNSNFCRERLCSVCAWRRQARFLATTEPALKKIDIEHNGKAQYIFVTLTVKNCSAKALSGEITRILKAWDRLYKRKPFAAFALGGVRSVEVTYNAEENTYHPHLHALLLMKNEYFKRGNIISQQKLRVLWQHALQYSYEPFVYIQSIKAQQGKDERIGATLETIKYSLKTKDFAISAEVTKTLMVALKGRRLISFFGVVAAARRDLNYQDLFNDNLNDDIEAGAACARSVLYLFSPAGWKIVNN
jgi:plasmid rolling circle replication initiator protein Rep